MKTDTFIAEGQRAQRAAERTKDFSAALCALCPSAMNEFEWRFVHRGATR
jgi:hypothetical protein